MYKGLSRIEVINELNTHKHEFIKSVGNYNKNVKNTKIIYVILLTICSCVFMFNFYSTIINTNLKYKVFSALLFVIMLFIFFRNLINMVENLISSKIMQNELDRALKMMQEHKRMLLSISDEEFNNSNASEDVSKYFEQLDKLIKELNS